MNLASSSSMGAIFSLLQHAQPTSSGFCRQPLPAQTQLHPTTTIDRQIIGLLTHCVVMVTDFHPMQYLIPPLICKIPYDLGYINSASSIYGWLIDTVRSLDDIASNSTASVACYVGVLLMFVIVGILRLYSDPDTGYPDRDIPRFFSVLQSKYQNSASD
jgi:hypothetical protein